MSPAARGPGWAEVSAGAVGSEAAVGERGTDVGIPVGEGVWVSVGKGVAAGGDRVGSIVVLGVASAQADTNISSRQMKALAQNFMMIAPYIWQATLITRATAQIYDRVITGYSSI